MLSSISARKLILTVGLALALPVFAAPMKSTIHIRQPLQVGDATLAPGDYSVLVDGNETTFSQGRKVIAKVTSTLKDGTEKSSQDAVLYANGAITEIRFSGQSQVVKFSPVSTASTPAKSNSTAR